MIIYEHGLFFDIINTKWQPFSLMKTERGIVLPPEQVFFSHFSPEMPDSCSFSHAFAFDSDTPSGKCQWVCLTIGFPSSSFPGQIRILQLWTTPFLIIGIIAAIGTHLSFHEQRTGIKKCIQAAVSCSKLLLNVLALCFLT